MTSLVLISSKLIIFSALFYPFLLMRHYLSLSHSPLLESYSTFVLIISAFFSLYPLSLGNRGNSYPEKSSSASGYSCFTGRAIKRRFESFPPSLHLPMKSISQNILVIIVFPVGAIHSARWMKRRRILCFIVCPRSNCFVLIDPIVFFNHKRVM